MEPSTSHDAVPRVRAPLSAIVISYNRADIVGTCLRALAFADEVILIDKSSTDETALVGAQFADRVISVPWTPTVEETREFAVSCAKYEWILLIDDDECLSVEAVRFIQRELEEPRADVYALPQRHYILGKHDEAAYYWPEFQPRLFRRGAVILNATVHGGSVRAPEARLYAVPPETGVCMHHLSHKNVSQWIEKANRYTDNPDRLSAEDFSSDLVAYAHKRIDHFVSATQSEDRSSYPHAVAVLRALYDVIDRLKRWEAEHGVDGHSSFRDICARLNAEYDAAFPCRMVAHVATERHEADPAPVDAGGATPTADGRTVQMLLDALRHLRSSADAAQRRSEDLIQEQRAFFEAEKDRLRLLYEADVANHKASFEAETQRLRQAYEAHAASQTEDLNGYISRLWQLESERRALWQDRERHVHALQAAREHIQALESSTSWRLTKPLRRGIERVRGRGKRLRTLMVTLKSAVVAEEPTARAVLRNALLRRLRLLLPAQYASLLEKAALTESNTQALAPHQAATASYSAWTARFDTPSAEHRIYLLKTADQVPQAGFLCFFGPDELPLVGQTVAALRQQLGLRWTAALVFSEDCNAEVVTQQRALVADDPRFLPQGQFPDEAILILLQAGAIPRSHGPRVLVEAMARRSGAAMAYGDEDRLDESNVPTNPWFKPRFSEALLRQGRLLGRMVAKRARPGEAKEWAQRLWQGGVTAVDLAMIDAACEAGEAGCVHVPHVLFHDLLPARHYPFTPPALPEQLPVVSIIIPTRNAWHLLEPCLQSLTQTDWPQACLEVIVVDNGSDDPATLDGLRRLEAAGALRIERDARPFNYARLNNVAVQVSRGSVLVFLNNDTEVRDPSWLKQLVALTLLPGAGAVGAKLLYGDGTVQHGGVILGVQGTAGHAHLHLQADEGGYMNLANVTREMSAVTGACLAITREAFEEVGGFREEFRVAFNDVVLCLDSFQSGRRNFYLAAPIVTHHESKTRGYDDTPEKIREARRETCMAWFRHAPLLRNDPYYSPNLSLEQPFALSFAPRRRPAWRPAPSGRLKVMMLSITHGRGHGVAVVIDQQVSALLARGHEVVMAGHRGPNDFSYAGHPILEVHDPRSAATLALELEVDLIVAHTPPYFGVARWTGGFPPVLSYDYGEPPPELFPDAVARREVNDVKNMELARSTAVYAISQAVADEAFVKPRGVLPLANSHLGRWDENAAARRREVREREGWAKRFVVLNVCRFGEGERRYKGVDTFAQVREALFRLDPNLAVRSVFVLCGKGSEQDVAAMVEAGLEVRANVTDEEMSDLYAAADAYANFSLWEGYNLGIGQALAMGLPVVASDIPPHRAFGVSVCKSSDDAARLLRGIATQPPERTPVIWEWADAMETFVAAVEAVAAEGLSPDGFPAR